MRQIWKISGVNAGRFLVVTEEEAEEMIAAGVAQCALENASGMKPAVYQDRMMRNAGKPKAKRKRRTKAQIAEDEATEQEAAAAEEPSPDEVS